MFNRRFFENSLPDGCPVLEILNTATEESGPRRFVPLKSTRVKGEVIGPLASLRLIQTFSYRADECDKTLEALYRFPLPGDAAVRSVSVRFGQVQIQTELKERNQAEEDYKLAKEQGKQAILATRESPDVFTLKVAGLKPDEEIVVDTCYVQLARNEGAGWSLRIPLTTAPRYVRSDEFGSRPAEGQPLALMRDPGHRFSLDLRLAECGEVESPTHPLEVTRGADACRVRLRDGEVIPDRDCVLTWRTVQPRDQAGLTVLLEDYPDSPHVYFLALATPPATRDFRGVPREAIVLVDHSGSMDGAKWDAADWAVERFLSGLRGHDTLALGLFHNETRWFDAAPRAAGEETVRAAIGFLKQHRDSGGTELGVALEQALDQRRTEGNVARHVLIITDAQVSDTGRILRLAEQESKRPDRRRVSVLCIDSAPNSFLATRLAERGGGVSRFLTSAPQEGDITTALDELLADWSEPILTGLKLEVNRSGVEAAGRQVGFTAEAAWSAIDLGDMPAGRPVWCVGRIPRGGSGEIAFRLTVGKGHKIAACSPTPQPTFESQPFVRCLFGAERIIGLEQLIQSGRVGDQLADQVRLLGYDPAKVLTAGTEKVYAENVRNDLHAALRGLLVEESLHYGLASAETAFVAVCNEPGRPVEASVVVGNALPAGWAMHVTYAAMAPPMMRARGRGIATAYFDAADAGATLGLLATRSDMCESAAVPASFGAMLEAAEVAVPRAFTLFDGVPQFEQQQAVLFDSSSSTADMTFPGGATFDQIRVAVSGADNQQAADPGLCLWLFVDDAVAPRARVRLADIVRAGGARPLNLRWRSGQLLRLVLSDPAGAWAQTPPQLRVELGVSSGF
jgi:Ca-activated chloride channel family protein